MPTEMLCPQFPDELRWMLRPVLTWELEQAEPRIAASSASAASDLHPGFHVIFIERLLRRRC
jgi:hypothetical protein